VIYNKINQGAILTSAELSEHAIALVRLFVELVTRLPIPRAGG
jgi:hypothetical protein